jgi:hypothetical protein
MTDTDAKIEEAKRKIEQANQQLNASKASQKPPAKEKEAIVNNIFFFRNKTLIIIIRKTRDLSTEILSF